MSIKNEKCINKKYMLSFTLATNQEGNTTVMKELKDFIDSKNWCTERVIVSNYNISN
jgi:hypothetical protein